MGINNFAKTKIVGKKVGIFFGEFAPFHIGHLSVIHQALLENDYAILVISGSNRKTDRGMSINLPLECRFRYLRETFNDEPSLRVVMVNEDKMPDYPAGWDAWTSEFRTQVLSVLEDDIEQNHRFTIYIGENEYDRELQQRLPPNYYIRQVERQELPISATQIRKKPIKYWDYIVPQFRRHFVKKILIIGSTSEEKSALIRRLAKEFQAPFSEEYARHYKSIHNICEEELTESDYICLINGQFERNQQAINNPHSKGIAFLNTNAIVTRCNAKLYLSDSAINTLEPFFQYTIIREKLDLILILPPVTKGGDKDFHAMEQRNSSNEFHKKLMTELIEFELLDKTVFLTTNDNSEDFFTLYKEAKKEIEKLFV